MCKEHEDWMLSIYKAKLKNEGVVNEFDLSGFKDWLNSEQGQQVADILGINTSSHLWNLTVAAGKNSPDELEWEDFIRDVLPVDEQSKPTDTWEQATGSIFDTSSGVVTLNEDADLPFVGDELDILALTRLSMHLMYASDDLIDACKLGSAKDFETCIKVLDLVVTHIRNSKKLMKDYIELRSIIEG